MRTNDPTLTFLAIGPEPTLWLRRVDLGSLDIPHLVQAYFDMKIEKSDLVSGLISRWVIDPLFCESWPGEEFCDVLASNTALTCLAIGNCHVEQEAGTQFGKSLSLNSTLQTLFVDCCSLGLSWGIGLGDGLARKIGEFLASNSTLTELDLGSDNMGDMGGIYLGEALAVNSTLTRLELRSNKIGDEGGARIGEALAVNSALRSLDLSSNQLGPAAGVKIGEALLTNSALTRLNLNNNKIEQVGAGRIGEHLAINSPLCSLILSSNEIGADGGMKLGEALALNSFLTHLDLTDIQILGDVGAKIGASLALNPSLISLGLTWNQMNEDGIAKIEEGLAVNSSLTQIIGHNNLCDAPELLPSYVARNKHNVHLKTVSLFYLLLFWL